MASLWNLKAVLFRQVGVFLVTARLCESLGALLIINVADSLEETARETRRP